MATLYRQRRPQNAWSYESIFELDMERGASVIASTLSDESRQKAITETFADLERFHRRVHLDIFAELLVHRLSERGDRAGAAAVHQRYLRDSDAGKVSGPVMDVEGLPSSPP